MLRIKITRIAARQDPCEAPGQDREKLFFFPILPARRAPILPFGLPERSLLFLLELLALHVEHYRIFSNTKRDR